jgi:predicted TIM-barrel fold metal-dependent hydrolase
MINDQSQLAQAFWEKGGQSDCPILDFHGHMGPNMGCHLPRKTAEQMLGTMDSCNVPMICFCGHQSLFSEFGYLDDVKACRDHPGRFRAYFPVLSNWADAPRDIARINENPDVYVGFKFLCDYFATKLSDPVHAPYFQYADDHRMLVLSHTWQTPLDGADEGEKILQRYPNLVFIAGHSFHGEWDRAVQLANKYPNLYLELTAVADDRGVIDKFVKEAGSDRILFGTDLPWFTTLTCIGAVLSADITDDDRRNIFYRNGARLLERFPWFDRNRILGVGVR